MLIEILSDLYFFLTERGLFKYLHKYFNIRSKKVVKILPPCYRYGCISNGYEYKSLSVQLNDIIMLNAANKMKNEIYFIHYYNKKHNITQIMQHTKSTYFILKRELYLQNLCKNSYTGVVGT